MTNDVVEILMTARDRLIDGRCKQQLAKDANGFKTEPNNPDAVSWCPLGALSPLEESEDTCSYHFSPNGQTAIIFLSATKDCNSIRCSHLMKEDYPVMNSIWRHNDCCEVSDQEIVDWFDRAIRLAKESLHG